MVQHMHHDAYRRHPAGVAGPALAAFPRRNDLAITGQRFLNIFQAEWNRRSDEFSFTAGPDHAVSTRVCIYKRLSSSLIRGALQTGLTRCAVAAADTVL